MPRIAADTQPVQLIFDFDSTVVALEGLDELARIALADDPERERTVEAIEAITRDGMSGAIGIDVSLKRRLAMLTIRRAHVDAVVKLLKRKLSPSFRKHIAAVRRNADRIHVIEAGRVVETGTHAQLVKLGGLYSRLAKQQSLDGDPVTAVI